MSAGWSLKRQNFCSELLSFGYYYVRQEEEDVKQ